MRLLGVPAFVVAFTLVTGAAVAGNTIVLPVEPKGPAPDSAVIGGPPQPSAQPTCGAKAAGIYVDPNGCLYACSDGVNSILATGLTHPCVFPTP